MLKDHHLTKSIEDAAWGELTNNIIYKAESAGKTYIKVNPRNTSKTCSACGSIKEGLKLDEREYHCDSYGITMDRDKTAAVNILRIGKENIFKRFII